MECDGKCITNADDVFRHLFRNKPPVFIFLKVHCLCLKAEASKLLYISQFFRVDSFKPVVNRAVP